MAVSADDICRIFKEELGTALASLEKKQSEFEHHLTDLDSRVAGLEKLLHHARGSSEPPRKAPRVGWSRSPSLPPSSSPPATFSEDTIEVNGWLDTTLRDNIKDSLGKLLKEAGVDTHASIVVLRKYGDRALVKFSDHDAGVKMLSWWREQAPKYTTLTGQARVLYARWRPAREHAHAEWVWRRAYKVMGELGMSNLEKEKTPLVIYQSARPIAHIKNARLIATESWPKEVEFKKVLEQLEAEHL